MYVYVEGRFVHLFYRSAYTDKKLSLRNVSVIILSACTGCEIVWITRLAIVKKYTRTLCKSSPLLCVDRHCIPNCTDNRLMKWTLYIKLFGTVKWFLQHESQAHCGLNYNEACPLPVHKRKRIVLLSFGWCYLQLQSCYANCFVKLNSIENLENPSSDSIKPRIPYKIYHVLTIVNAFTTNVRSCTYLRVFQKSCRTGESKLKFAILKLWSSSSYICHGVGPLVDPFRSHVSRSLFKGLPWFLLPAGE